MRQLIEIVPKYVNDAGEGKKYGNVKIDEKTKYLYPKAMNGQIPKTPFKAETHTEQWKDGPVTIIDKVIGGNGAAAAKQNLRARMDPVDSLEARKTAVLVAYVTAGKIPLGGLGVALDEIDVHLRAHAAKSNRQRRDDMADEIPEDDWAINSENPTD